MKSDGNVLEMSSLMRSRLDSLSARDAPSATHSNRIHSGSDTCSQVSQLVSDHRTALAVVHGARLTVAPPLLFGSGQEDLIEFCTKHERIRAKEGKRNTETFRENPRNLTECGAKGFPYFYKTFSGKQNFGFVTRDQSVLNKDGRRVYNSSQNIMTEHVNNRNICILRRGRSLICSQVTAPLLEGSGGSTAIFLRCPHLG